MSYLELLSLLAPEVILVITMLVVLAADLSVFHDLELPLRRSLAATTAIIGCLIACAWAAAISGEGNFMLGMLVVDPLTRCVKIGILLLTICVLVLSIRSEFTEHVGEYFSLLLIATTGMMLLVSSEDILMVFLSLELTSICLYVITAFHQRDSRSAEAALKYYLFGGMASAFTLFGLSLLYGIAGSTNLGTISAVISGASAHGGAGPVPGTLDPLLAGAMVMVLAGFGFKIAAVPFHLWAPDAYQGAPIPSAALIASGSKLASFFILAKFVMLGFAGEPGECVVPRIADNAWIPILTLLACLSMVVGNLAALAQSSVRRLLAYSAIAHAGYVLLGVMSPGAEGMASIIYYVGTYGLATVGAFGVAGMLERSIGRDDFAAFAGLSQRAPVLALCLAVFVLSLAGIPPLAGFLGKFYVFASAFSGNPGNSIILWLVVLALGASAVSLFYYLQILKQAYVRPADPKSPALNLYWPERILAGGLAAAVLLLGCVPEPVIRAIRSAARAAGFE